MPQLLRRALGAPHNGRMQRRNLIKAMFGSTLDGYAGWRVAERLLNLAAAEPVPQRQGVMARLVTEAGQQKEQRETA